jgi:SAM-dependent methyltransferase
VDALSEPVAAVDPYAHLKERCWRESEALDAALARGELSEEEWHRGWQGILVPAYLAAETPWEQSGKSGTEEDWVHARSLVSDAIDRDGSFLDVGCANGYLMECLPGWTAFAVEPYGLDLSPELVALARPRLPAWWDRLWIGNALTWTAPQRFTYVRTGLDYVPRGRRAELVERLLAIADRLIVGVFGEHESELTTETALREWGHAVCGRSVRRNRRKPGMEYRVLWIDA